jgi:hypothetical protein
MGGRRLALDLVARLKVLEVRVADGVEKLIKTRPSRPVLAVGGVAFLSTLLSIVLAIVLSRPVLKPHAAPSEFKPLKLEVETAEPAPVQKPTDEPPLTRPPLPLAPSPPEPVLARDEGFLEVTLTPAGTISIDGKEATAVEGTQRFKVNAGHHEVTASDSKVVVGWSVYVRPGATVRKQYAFRRRK